MIRDVLERLARRIGVFFANREDCPKIVKPYIDIAFKEIQEIIDRDYISVKLVDKINEIKNPYEEDSDLSFVFYVTLGKVLKIICNSAIPPRGDRGD